MKLLCLRLLLPLLLLPCLWFTMYENEVLQTYEFWGKKNLFKIPDWKMKIYYKHDISLETIIKLHTLNSIECGRWDWLCNRADSDVWPFQINFIHKKEFKKSLELIKEKKVEELFEYQMLWTWARMKRMEKNFCKKRQTQSKKMECQAILHNWGKKAKSYWIHAVIVRDLLIQHILNNLDKKDD